MPKRTLGTRYIEVSALELRGFPDSLFEDVASLITVQGARYSEAAQRMIDR